MIDASATSSIDQRIERERAALAKLARDIHARPELRFEEHEAARAIADYLERVGFSVERGVGGMPTAFRARAGKSGGPRVAVLAEYDALPDIGHACGHNLIAAAGVGAFVGAAAVAERAGGEVVLLGTPAEEGGGGKIKLIEAGAFANVDAAMMFHPFDRDILVHPFLALCTYLFRFGGKASHAAAAPHDGRNALTACMDTFHLIDSQRATFRDGVRVHGIIRDGGGQASNVIPETASAEIVVRAQDEAEHARVRAIVERCARAAAMASDVTLAFDVHEGYRSLKNNFTMARAFGAHCGELGRAPKETDPTAGTGSTDMGDVSQVVPSIHPMLGIVDQGTTTIHQRDFAAAAASDRGVETALVAAKAMARTAIELITDTALRERVRAEFAAAR
ncbi:MAG TPA: amidohydrolase [Polyangiaceae bacterium]